MAAGVDDVAVAAVIFFDALGDVVIYAVRSALIPHANFVHLALHDLTHQPVGVVAVGVVKVPHIADGRMAIADVHSIRAGDNPLGAGGGR